MSVILRVHEAVYKATGGLVGHRVLFGAPVELWVKFIAAARS